MKHTVSLKGNRSFRRMYSKGKSAATATLVLYIRRNGAGENRLGLTVGTKVGKAVRRNRIRRRLREIYRLHEDGLRRGWDIVAVARTRAAEASYRELEADFLRAAARLGLDLP
jgi:ribonuclease P protein component